MQRTHSITSFSDDELLRRLAELLAQTRRSEADLVAHIGEVDRRRLYAREASPSMFAYCTEVLHLSEAEAYLRIAVARAAREHPHLLASLAEGRLHLTAIAKLAPHLTPENREALLERAVHKSKREIEALVAELSPRPDAPAGMRRLPDRKNPAVSAPSVGPAPSLGRRPKDGTAIGLPLRPDGVVAREPESRPDAVTAVEPETRPCAAANEPRPSEVVAPRLELRPDADGPRDELRPDAVAETGVDHVPSAAVGRPTLRSARPAVVESLAPARYKVQFTASAELHDKLLRLQALMRHSVPDGDLAAIVEQAVTEKLQRLEARRFALTPSPRKTLAESDTSPATRRIPAAVKRAVHERDAGRCAYEDERGRRCTARQGLEFHHRHPFGHGGDHSVANLSLVCRNHNGYLAEIDYGRTARHRDPRAAPGASAASSS